MSDDMQLVAMTMLNPSASDKAQIVELAQRLNEAEAELAGQHLSEAEEREAQDHIFDDVFRGCDGDIAFAAIQEASRQRLRALKTLPALTLMDYGNGEWAVTLNDYGGPHGDEFVRTRIFTSKEEAESFIAECRANIGQNAEHVYDDRDGDDDPIPW